MHPASAGLAGCISSLSITTPEPVALVGVEGVAVHERDWRVEASIAAGMTNNCFCTHPQRADGGDAPRRLGGEAVELRVSRRDVSLAGRPFVVAAPQACRLF